MEKRIERRKNGERKERRERGEREALPTLYDLRRSGSRFPTDQELKSEYSTRATRGHRKFQVSPRFHAGGL